MKRKVSRRNPPKTPPFVDRWVWFLFIDGPLLGFWPWDEDDRVAPGEAVCWVNNERAHGRWTFVEVLEEAAGRTAGEKVVALVHPNDLSGFQRDVAPFIEKPH